MDTFKKPRDQFVDDVLESFVRSGKKNIQGPVSNHHTLIAPARDPTPHLLSLDSEPSLQVPEDLVFTPLVFLIWIQPRGREGA